MMLRLWNYHPTFREETVPCAYLLLLNPLSPLQLLVYEWMDVVYLILFLSFTPLCESLEEGATTTTRRTSVAGSVMINA